MIDKRLHTDRKYAALTILILIAGCIVGFSGVNLGMPGPGDESFQALCVADYRNSPLGMLAFYIGHLWQQLAGATVLSLRCLASLEMLIAVGVGSFYLYRRSRRAMLSAGVFAICVTIARATAFQLYNWDSGSYLFDAVALVAVASFLRGGDSRQVFLAAIAAACMALARVPSVIFIPIIFGFVWAGCRRHGFTPRATALTLTLYTVSVAATALLLVTLICGSPAEYLASFRPENIITGHSPSDLHLWLDRLRDYSSTQLIWLAPSVGALWIALFLYRLRPGHPWLCAGLILMLIAFSALIYHHRDAWCYFEWNSLGTDLPLLVFMLLLFPAWNLTHSGSPRLNTPRLELWWCAAMAMMMTLGSDTFYERMCGGFILPVVIAAGWPAAITSHGMLRLGRNALLLSLAVFGAVVAEQWVMKARINTTVPPPRYAPLRGLRVPADLLNWLEVNEAAVNSARTLGMRYVICANRFIPQLVLGRDNGPRLSIFHIDTSNPSQWPPEQNLAIDSAQMVIFNGVITPGHLVFDHLRTLGFSEVASRCGVQIFVRPHPSINGDTIIEQTSLADH